MEEAYLDVKFFYIDFELMLKEWITKISVTATN